MKYVSSGGILLDTSKSPIARSNYIYKVRKETISLSPGGTTGGGGSTGGGPTGTGSGTFTAGIIPIDPREIYMDNSQQVRFDALVDSDLLSNFSPVAQLSNLIYPNYDIVFNLQRYSAQVSKVDISYGGGSGGTTQTDVIIVKQDGTEVLIGTWTQAGYQQTDSFIHSGAYLVSKVILRARTNASYGAEVRIYGTYQVPVTAPKQPKTPIGYQAGWNIHPWNLCYSDKHAVDPLKLAAFESMDLYNGSIRCYDDWYATQDLDGTWRIGCEIRGFVIDQAYTQLKADMPDMVKWRCLQNQSLYIENTWDTTDPNKYLDITVKSYTDNGSWGWISATINNITGQFSANYYHVYSGGVKIDTADQTSGTTAIGSTVTFNVGGGKGYTVGQILQLRKSQKSQVGVPWPADGNLQKDLFTPYDLIGQAAFVYASRLGTNPNVPDYPVPLNDPLNTMTKGSNLCQIFEFGNEWNAWWKDFNGFWNGKSFFYAWSMCYDGHKGAYTNRGVKQADPTAKMATTGLATDRLDLIWGAYEEARKQRGYTASGEVDVPWDIVNFHCYSSSGGQYSGSQGGLPPEQGMWRQVKDWVWWVENFSPNSEIYISEWGWDANQGSPLCAKTFGPYTDPRQVAGMWHVRGMLLFAREGINRAQAYRLFQDFNSDDTNPTQFATMAGLRENSSTSFTRTAVGDYFKQLMEFRNYSFTSEVPTNLSGVYCWKFSDGTKTIAILWSEEQVEIINNVPNFTERTGSFNIPVTAGQPITIRSFVDDGSGIMASQIVTPSSSTYTIAYGSKPKIIQF